MEIMTGVGIYFYKYYILYKHVEHLLLIFYKLIIFVIIIY